MIRKALFLALVAVAGTASAEYSFEVVNNADSRIVGLEASEDGETWGKFDIGKGIPVGGSTTLVWDQSTDDSGCAWWFKAHYADGAESEPAAFDFCEDDLVLEFN